MGLFNTFRTGDEENLISSYSTALFKKSAEAAKLIRDAKNETSKMNDEEWMKVFFEFLYFFLHLTDRDAFEVLDERKRDSIMSKLENLTIPLAVQTICQDWPGDMIKKVQSECTHNFNVSMDEYAKYKKWFPEKDEVMKDTLLWEFSKNIACFAGEEYSPAFIMMATEIAVKSYIDLVKTGFIKKIK